MSPLLQPATLTQRAAKIGIFGKPGSGKTLTSILLLIGLAKRDGNRPIAMMDTEGGSDFVKELCDIEGVPLLVVKSRSFVEMRDALREAEAGDCSGFLVDSYSAPWFELNEAIREKLNLRGRKLQFEHRDELYRVWGDWTREMLDSPLHCVLSGRLSNEWDDIVSDEAQVEHVKVGTKMRGEADAGYEPHLLIEMDAIRDSLSRDAKTRSKRGKMIHGLTVLKDRFRILNGRSFQFPDINDYKPLGYAKTFAAIAPHVERLAPGRTVSDTPRIARSSTELFQSVTGESAYSERQRRVSIALEEIHDTLRAIWAGETADEKRLRAIVMKSVFGLRSKTAIESLPAETLESARLVIGHFETAVMDKEQQINVRDEAQIVDLILSCKGLERERSEAAVL